jgi:hypothetical protein
MINAFTSMFWREKPQKNSLCPNSFAPMPKNKFHNYAIEIREHDDDQEPNKTIWGVFEFEKKFKKNIFYTLYSPPS